MPTPTLGFHAAAQGNSELATDPSGCASDAAQLPIVTRQMNEWAVEQIQAFLDGMRHTSRWMQDLVGLSEFTVELVLRMLGSQRSSLMVLDNQQILRIMAARGVPEWVRERTALRLGEGVAGRVASVGRPLLAEHIRAGSNTTQTGGHYRSDTFLCVPVPGEQRVLGVVNVTDPLDEAPFERGDLQCLINIADSVGSTLEQTIRYRELEAQALKDELTGLYNRRHLQQFLDTILTALGPRTFPLRYCFLI